MQRSRVSEAVRGGGANIFMKSTVAGNYDNRNLSIAKNGELLGHLEEAVASLSISDFPVGDVF